jgi:cation diffusion facilitator CzcD-associated flavoprotein CzcO
VATIDRDALRQRYLAERDKRLRPDGNDQYLEPVGRFAGLLGDPYVPRTERAPVREEATVVLVGAGFAGLCAGARLREAGVTGVRLIDGAGDVGGAWYWNRYPGAMCDTAAMIYLPLLEETGHAPTRKYVMGPEILEHARRIAKTFDLYDGALFSTSVTRLEWHEQSARWIVRTDRGDAIATRFVALGTGPLSRPKLPGILGMESFGGHAFHTSRWDYGYTGGDSAGAPMVQLAGKRVGLIGTGATAVQCVPPLARDAGELFVFQRTPSSVDVRNNHPIDPDWFATLGPGWQREWLLNFATLQTGGFADEDLVKDGWTDISQRIRDRAVEEIGRTGQFTPEVLQKAYEDSDDEKMEEIRARVDAIVADPATAAALKPWYRQLCKRPCFHDEYLEAFNRPNCHLVDTDGKGVERVDETGVWAEGVHYPVDCLIFASGFEVGTSYERRTGFDVIGRGGATLEGHWADGMRSMHGVHVHGFPNLFILGFSQGAALVSNVTHNLTDAGATVAAVVRHATDTGATDVEVTAEAEDAWMGLLEGTVSTIFGNPDCTPGYYNNEGQPFTGSARLSLVGHPQGAVAFFEHIEGWRASGAFEGLEFRPGTT